VVSIVVVISSLIVVLSIMMNHEVVDTLDQVVPGETIDWGEHQVLTTHNFGIDSLLSLHMSGGLNLQIEHHLLPGVPCTRLRRARPIVRAYCERHGLPYHQVGYLAAWREALGHCRRMARIAREAAAEAPSAPVRGQTCPGGAV
jgi:fatty acid desaturase